MSGKVDEQKPERRLNILKRGKEPEPEINSQNSKRLKVSGNQQSGAFAAQNLENMAMYDVDKEDCGECHRKINVAGHFR